MKSHKIALSLAALALTTGAVAMAAETQSVDTDTIVVQADRYVDEPADTVIDVGKTNIGAAKTVPELLRHTAGMQVQARPNSGGNEDLSVKLRGHDSRHYTVLVDGVPQAMSGVMGGSYVNWNAIPLDLVDKIEITKGAKSVAYGQTEGGVINIVTKRSYENGGSLQLAAGSNGRRQYSLNYGVQKEKFGAAIYANKSVQDAYLRNSDYDNRQIGINLHYNLNATDQFKVNVDHAQIKRGLVVTNILGTPGYNSYYPTTPQGDSFASAGTNVFGDGSYTKIYHTNFNVVWDSQRANGSDTLTYWRNNEKQHEVGINGKTHALAFDRYNVTDKSSGIFYNGTFKVDDKHTLGYGIDYKRLRYGYGWYNVNNDNSSGLYPSQKVDTLGIYAEDTWTMGNRWTGNAGLRYDQMRGDKDDNRAGYMKSMRDSSISPKVNFTFKNNAKTTTAFSINRIWRAPSMAEFYWYNAGPAFGMAPLTRVGLKPEKGWGYEASIDHQFSDALHSKVTAYYQDIQDYINFTHTYPFNAYNIDNAKLWGVELENTYQINPYASIFLNYTNQHTKKDGVNVMDKVGLANELDYRPRHSLSLGYQFDKGTWHARYDMTYTSEQKATKFFPATKPMDASIVQMGGYVVHNVSVTKDFSTNTSLNVSIYNLFDKNYSEIYGYPMEGRFYTAALTQKF